VVTGKRPTNSGRKPYEIRSSTWGVPRGGEGDRR
jgi:hypothetical protein